ncbi:hypothetical protein HRI_005108400 [Hibiscus trionum]|uniref:RRM domain-containing protein n=1 Tax=Hibiscus trionum TaxID=183268 RepID=A0A9W7JFL8_HIBTR|nr:hypothetical protein HRI_005108400 [Hibiscus trionum]
MAKASGRGKVSLEARVTLFVKKLHWKGLWTLFSYHGDVLDAFIPKKRSRGGHRFGFVRYLKMNDALRAQERLDGFHIFGYRVQVHLARFDLSQVNNQVQRFFPCTACSTG